MGFPGLFPYHAWSDPPCPSCPCPPCPPVSLSFSCSVSILLPAVPPRYEALSVFEVRSVLRLLGPDCSSSFSSYMSPGFGENKTALSFSFWSQVGPLHFPVTTYWLIQVLLFSGSSDTTFIAPSFFCTNVNTMVVFWLWVICPHLLAFWGCRDTLSPSFVVIDTWVFGFATWLLCVFCRDSETEKLCCHLHSLPQILFLLDFVKLIFDSYLTGNLFSNNIYLYSKYSGNADYVRNAFNSK